MIKEPIQSVRVRIISTLSTGAHLLQITDTATWWAVILTGMGHDSSHITHHMSHNTRGARPAHPILASVHRQLRSPGRDSGPQLTRPQHNNTNSRWYNESTDRRPGLIFYFDQQQRILIIRPRSTTSTRFSPRMNVNFSDLTSVNCSYSIWVCVCIVLD